MDIELEIEGVPDGPIADAIRDRVRNLRHQIALTADWRVTIAPSETRGEWDLGILTPSGWQLASFAEPVERLPEVIERELRERLSSNLSPYVDWTALEQYVVSGFSQPDRGRSASAPAASGGGAQI